MVSAKAKKNKSRVSVKAGTFKGKVFNIDLTNKEIALLKKMATNATS